MERVFYEEVFRALNKHGVRYLPRAPVALEDFADAAKREAWRREKGAVVFTLNDPRDPLTQVDVFLENPIDFQSAYEARQLLEAGDMTLAVISIDNLIRLKSLANRLQDKSDIAMFRKVQSERQRDARAWRLPSKWVILLAWNASFMKKLFAPSTDTASAT